MGGIGRSQNVGRTRRKEPSKEHRVKNIRSDEPNFKIGNQKLVSQAFASDLVQEDEKQKLETMFAERKEKFLKQSRGHRSKNSTFEPSAEPVEIEERVEESDSEPESFPTKPNKYSASTASTSCGNSPNTSDAEGNTDDEEEEKAIEELRQSYKKLANKRSQADNNNNMPSACIARSIGKEEMMTSEKGLKALEVEWKKLWDQTVWDPTVIKNYHQVMYEAKASGSYIHIGKLFSILAE